MSLWAHRLVMYLALPLTIVGLVAGCAVPTEPDGRPVGVEEQPRPAGPIGRPPPVTIRVGERSAALEPWTYCFGNGCADGVPPSNPVDVGEADGVVAEFPLAGWTFEATFVPVGDACPRRHVVPVRQTGDHTFAVDPAGPADTYDVTLFGRGDGDLVVTFRWTTTRDGVMPIPKARLAVLANHDGSVDSYGVELELSDLASTPEMASAVVTVTAADGASLTFDAIRAPGCFGDGVVYWDGSDEAGLAAAELGPAPFEYAVTVTIDGAEHRATATWPDDEIAGNEPSVVLDFDPPLPALP